MLKSVHNYDCNCCKEEIKTLILHSEFSKAKDLTSLVDYQTLSNILMIIVFDYKNICAYTFIFILLSDRETNLAMDVLMHVFPHLQGAYESGMYHVKRSIELDPDDVGLKELLLFFNDVPCKPIKDQEERQIALEILAVDKDNKIALDTITKLTRREKE